MPLGVSLHTLQLKSTFRWTLKQTPGAPTGEAVSLSQVQQEVKGEPAQPALSILKMKKRTPPGAPHGGPTAGWWQSCGQNLGSPKVRASSTSVGSFCFFQGKL